MKRKNMNTYPQIEAMTPGKWKLLTPGECVKALRQELGMSQTQLAVLTGTQCSAISSLERGHRPLTIKNAKKIARALQVDYRVLIFQMLYKELL